MLPPVIMVADDLDIVRSVCKNALQGRGFDVVEAADGPAAVRLFEAFKERIVFSLVDVSMPGMDGFDVVRSILRQQPAAATALISGADAAANLPGDLAGRCLTLNKPFTVSTLRDMVEKAVSAAPQVQAARTC